MSQPKVIIFIGTYNGQNYLAEQLDSISLQTHNNWELWVSDDGSSDNTHQILQHYQHRIGENIFFIHSGPRKGFSANFLSLICRKAEGSFYAYSDQDDIWEPDKLQKAVDWLTTIPDDIPALYCSRTKLINEHGETIGYSPLFKKRPGFLNALIQNIAGGNTMVFNNSAVKLLREAGQDINIGFHDWWTYMLVTGANGIVFYDAHPTVRYRQHASNLIGINTGKLARLYRLYRLFRGRFKQQNTINFRALFSIQHLLDDENKRVLNEFISARKCNFISRLIKIRQVGIYKQTLFGNIGLTLAALFNKL